MDSKSAIEFDTELVCVTCDNLYSRCSVCPCYSLSRHSVVDSYLTPAQVTVEEEGADGWELESGDRRSCSARGARPAISHVRSRSDTQVSRAC